MHPLPKRSWGNQGWRMSNVIHSGWGRQGIPLGPAPSFLRDQPNHLRAENTDIRVVSPGKQEDLPHGRAQEGAGRSYQLQELIQAQHITVPASWSISLSKYILNQPLPPPWTIISCQENSRGCPLDRELSLFLLIISSPPGSQSNLFTSLKQENVTGD